MSATSPDAVALLDVNVLVALVMPNHVSHAAAQSWFADHAGEGWATTPFTESGFVRVCSNRRAIVTPTTPGTALRMLSLLTARPGHRFWPDHVDTVVGAFLDPDRVTAYQQVTDAHLLAIAVAYRGQLVTFDRGVASLGGDRRHFRVLDGWHRLRTRPGSRAGSGTAPRDWP